MVGRSGSLAHFRVTVLVTAFLRILALVALMTALSACARSPSEAPAATLGRDGTPLRGEPAAKRIEPGLTVPAGSATVVETPEPTAVDVPAPGAGPADIIVYAADLPKSALYELEIWSDPASPGGKMIGLPNTGDELDPPPENDPHATISVEVRADTPYRCWVHMKVGPPKGMSQANVLWVQFEDALDKAGKSVLRPGSNDYLTAQGPLVEGWTWTGCNKDDASDPLIYFGSSGATKMRVQAGMEGVGFDQFVLSPGRFLVNPPSEDVIKK